MQNEILEKFNDILNSDKPAENKVFELKLCVQMLKIINSNKPDPMIDKRKLFTMVERIYKNSSVGSKNEAHALDLMELLK